MKKTILLLLCFSTSLHYSMEKPPMKLVSKPEPQFWATKKSHEKNPRRLKEELTEKIDLDALASQIHYDFSLLKQTGIATIFSDEGPITYEFQKKWYYGRKINTLLLNACYSDVNYEIVKKLLENKANPNTKIDRCVVWANPKVIIGEFFDTPLFTAVQHQAERNVELLLKAGARVTTTYGLGHITVLHAACSNKNSSPETKKNIINLLLAYGANPNALKN